MAEIRVSTAHLRNVAAQLAQLKAKLANEASTMRANQQSLTAMWDGPANETFDRAFNRNVTEFEAFSQLIQDYSNALLTYAEQYERTEHDNEAIAKTR